MTFWRTRDGGFIRIGCMEPEHLRNTIRMLRLSEHEDPRPWPRRSAWIRALEEEADDRGVWSAL